MQVDVQDTDTQLSKMLERMESGETVLLARQGRPVAELVPARKRIGLPFGIAANSPLVPPGDDWSGPLTEEELATWMAKD